MKCLTWFGKVGLLSVFTLLFLAALSSSVVLAGERPPDLEKKSSSSVESGEQMQVPTKTPETASGFTIGISGGVSIPNDADFSASAVEFDGFQYGPLDGTASFTTGYSLNFMVGYAFENGLRVGAEIGYVGNNCYDEMDVTMPGTLLAQVGLDSTGDPCLAGAAGCTSYKDLTGSAQEALSQGSVGTKKIKGKLNALTFMLSVYYDLDLGSNLVPYVGAGLGGANISTEVESNEGVTKGNLLVDDSDYVLAYQVGAGLGYEIGNILGLNDLMLTFDYRYLASMQDLDLQGSVTGNSFESEFGGHYIGGGIRLGL